jgi:metal-dependent amidase/aminoacylase/carboxypeptidase family protein
VHDVDQAAINDGDRTAALRAAVLEQRATILEVTRFVHEHPELAHEEVAGADRITAALDPLELERPFAGMATAFRAVLRGALPGPSVAVVAVYDAVGVPAGDGTLRPAHSCGHGPIAGAVAGAARALATLRADLAGTVIVLGLPADELVSPRAIADGSGKALAVDRGGFDGIDAVLYVHPESHTGVWRSSKWMQLFEVVTAADADPAGWALPFEAYRIDQVVPGADRTTVVVRALGDTEKQLDERAEAARLAVPHHSWTALGRTESLTADPRVAAAAESALRDLGLVPDPETPMMPFSTDFGNVSRRVPAAMIGLTRAGGWAVHTDEGERQFRSSAGEGLAVTMAEVIATAVDRLTRSFR